MRQHLLYAAVVVLALIVASPTASAQDVKRIEVNELRDKIGTADLFLIDVRTPSSWKQSQHKIAGAVRANPKNLTALDQMIPPGSDIVLYCA